MQRQEIRNPQSAIRNSTGSPCIRVLRGREKKCIAGFQPAKVVLTQKELSRLRCRRDAGATIFSHDLRLCGETLFWLRLPCAVSQGIHGREARVTVAAGGRGGTVTPARG